MTGHENNAARRSRNIASGACINENALGTHGPATHGRRCAACREKNRGEFVAARRARLGFGERLEIAHGTRVRAIDPVVAVGLPVPRASFLIEHHMRAA